MKKKFKKVIVGLISGTVLASIWVLIFYIAVQGTQYYGLAILPAIVIAIFLFIIGFNIGYLIVKKIKKIRRLFKK